VQWDLPVVQCLAEVDDLGFARKDKHVL
jgi:hypothetical protein